MALEQIKLIGRWKSLEMVKGYDQPNSAAFNRAQDILCDETNFSMEDLSFLTHTVTKTNEASKQQKKVLPKRKRVVNNANGDTSTAAASGNSQRTFHS